ncbi:MAG: hypothetical protein DMF61_09335 [Blastocatellia bacterium AA13]|nr:MAG: hypothetical protein DMF61_09335 [Blastocatellia bacterium AA13]
MGAYLSTSRLRPVCVWALSRWLVALIQKDSHIKSGLFAHGLSTRWSKSSPFIAARSKFSMLSGHRRRGIVRNAVDELRPLKRSPFTKEFRQLRKRGFLLLSHGSK